MRSPAKVLSSWFARKTAAATASAPMMEMLESRQFLSATLPTPIIVGPPIHGPVPVVPVIKSVGVTINAATGQKWTGIVGEVENIGATAIGALQISHLGNMQAAINWGDGSPSSVGSLYLNSRGWVVISGVHRYGASGLDSVSVVLTSKPVVYDPPSATVAPVVVATVSSTAQVVGGLTLTQTATQSFTSVVGYFRFGLNPTGTTAGWILGTTINWGDGSSSQGVITQVSPGFYSITGTHTYSKTGDYTTGISVTATPAPKGGINDPIILLVTSFDSFIDVKGHA